MICKAYQTEKQAGKVIAQKEKKTVYYTHLEVFYGE